MLNFLLSIIISGLAGTTLMTIISYVLTYTLKTQFKEPVLLQKFLQRSDWIDSGNTTAGWLVHYMAGFGWATIYNFLWRFSVIEPSYLNGSWLGLVSGIIGVGVWWILFKVHKNPPSINLTAYFIHLLVVHIIFGLGATAGYQLMRFM